MGDLVFDEPFGCLDSGGYNPWVEIIFLGFRLDSYMQATKRHPWTMPFMKFLLPHDLIRKQLDRQKMSFEQAKQCAELGSKDRPDLMSYVLCANQEQRLTLDEMPRKCQPAHRRWQRDYSNIAGWHNLLAAQEPKSVPEVDPGDPKYFQTGIRHYHAEGIAASVSACLAQRRPSHVPSYSFWCSTRRFRRRLLCRWYLAA
ncbi:uncharacterized protein A1O9_12550 [Exophiala aquamarina CBS 119918]|uniref:Uncharacterized protein n=1 Tax=Exophiala aquamarina CBS 119918 TaxID=1182545 RepID=A0A072NUU9_9EURO|nr:uncharacterized protein A1O9_12550 [Exophiala aquamarina CBS 119918]KEF51401.1 hypothetical protein A1O9_12550 [Exophiala aquamarina CBS 119918]